MAKKLLKAQKPSALDKERKAKRTGYRFKTKDNPKLHKKDGDLNAKGKELYFKKPTKSEVEKFKRHDDGSFDSETKQVYHERRADRKHSDDSPKAKFKTGGGIKRTKKGIAQDKNLKALHAGKRESENGNTYYESRPNRSDENRTKKFKKGGGVKRTKKGIVQDKNLKALHAGKRESADGNTYYENRPNRSDENRTKKFDEGGEATVEMSMEEMKTTLGREPKYPYDFIAGSKYVKCFLRPFYKKVD